MAEQRKVMKRPAFVMAAASAALFAASSPSAQTSSKMLASDRDWVVARVQADGRAMICSMVTGTDCGNIQINLRDGDKQARVVLSPREDVFERGKQIGVNFSFEGYVPVIIHGKRSEGKHLELVIPNDEQLLTLMKYIRAGTEMRVLFYVVPNFDFKKPDMIWTASLAGADAMFSSWVKCFSSFSIQR